MITFTSKLRIMCFWLAWTRHCLHSNNTLSFVCVFLACMDYALPPPQSRWHGGICPQSEALPPHTFPQSEGKNGQNQPFPAFFSLDFCPLRIAFCSLDAPHKKLWIKLTTKLCICVSGMLGLGIASTVITLICASSSFCMRSFAFYWWESPQRKEMFWR